MLTASVTDPDSRVSGVVADSGVTGADVAVGQVPERRRAAGATSTRPRGLRPTLR